MLHEQDALYRGSTTWGIPCVLSSARLPLFVQGSSQQGCRMSWSFIEPEANFG